MNPYSLTVLLVINRNVLSLRDAQELAVHLSKKQWDPILLHVSRDSDIPVEVINLGNLKKADIAEIRHLVAKKESA